MRQIKRLFGLLRKAGQQMRRFLGNTSEALAQRMTDLFARRLVAGVFLDLVVVLVTQRYAAVPKAVLTQLIGMTALTSVSESGEILSMTHRAASGMRDRFDRGQTVEQRQPD